ncbi:hypothetical protein LXA43DRAFT_1067231 [Ganoderma leucocontextum]|nr:hypothetical protein LXA43DRAFT_1067231 [Ganoderma leucocontextum]
MYNGIEAMAHGIPSTATVKRAYVGDQYEYDLSMCATFFWVSLRVRDSHRWFATRHTEIRIRMELPESDGTKSLTVDGCMHVLAMCHFVSLLSCTQTYTTFRAAAAAEIPCRLGTGGLGHSVGDSSYPAFIGDFEHLFPVALEADMSCHHRPHPTLHNTYWETYGSDPEPKPQRRGAPPVFLEQRRCEFHNAAQRGFVTDGTLTIKAVSAHTKYEGGGIAFTELASWRAGEGIEFEGSRIFSDGPFLDSTAPPTPTRPEPSSNSDSVPITPAKEVQVFESTIPKRSGEPVCFGDVVTEIPGRHDDELVDSEFRNGASLFSLVYVDDFVGNELVRNGLRLVYSNTATV